VWRENYIANIVMSINYFPDKPEINRTEPVKNMTKKGNNSGITHAS
jgi:hypothetical protein